MEERPETKALAVLSACYTALGMVTMLAAAHGWSTYLQTLHENQLWFSNIKEVEREISFRTEAGLYYSYFKHLVSGGAGSLPARIRELKEDNLTEHGNSINVFSRFNIHQELFLASFYRLQNFGHQPIMFYVGFVFSLQGCYLAVMFAIVWQLSLSWLPAMLMVAFVAAHKYSVTRVVNAVSLREHFSVPFVFAQFLAVGRYFDNGRKRGNERWDLLLVFASTFVFNLTWQFGPIVLLLQSVCLFYLGAIDILVRNQVCKVILVNMLSILCVWHMQYYQSMVLTSLFTSFVPVACLFLQLSQRSNRHKSNTVTTLLGSLGQLFSVLIVTVALNIIVRMASGQRADTHVLDFVRSKLGLSADETDFATRLYLCLPAFQALPIEFFAGFSRGTWAFPLHLVYVLSYSSFVALTAFAKWKEPPLPVEDRCREKSSEPSGAVLPKGHDASGLRSRFSKGRRRSESQTNEKEKPESGATSPRTSFIFCMDERPSLSFHLCQSLIFGLLAMSTQRMQVLWSPYICIFAACCVGNIDVWRLLANVLTKDKADEETKRRRSFISWLLRGFFTLAALLVVFASVKGEMYEELEDLREFYDPDTVDLMDWINAGTSPTAAFAGSMQLLAGVRLCTFRPITNHPHFEDEALRQRTKELYRMYGRASAEDVYATMVKYNASYIILEDSICLHAKSFRDKRCTLNDIMDLSMGFIPDDGIRNPTHLVEGGTRPRFCDEVRRASGAYVKYFKLAFANRTFRVYKVADRGMT